MATTSVLKLKAVDQVTGVLKRIGRAFPTLDRKIDNTRKRLKSFNDRFKDVTRSFRRFGRSALTVGRHLTTFVSLPIAAAGVGIINSFRKFEKALIGVGKTTDTEGPRLRALGNEFLDLSTRIPLSATKLLELGEVAGQLGVAAKDVVGFTEVLGKLQFATDIVGEEGAKSIARILTVTKEGTGVIDKFGASLVSLGNDAAASESEILGVAIRIAGNVSRFGVASTDILGISTTLKELGKESELAGSAVGRGFNAIDQALKNGGQDLKALQSVLSNTELGGLSGKALSKAFAKTPTKVFENFVKGLSEVDSSGGNVIKVMKIFGLEGVRINDIYGTLIKNTGLLNKRLKQSRREFRSSGKEVNALDKEANRAFKSVDAKIKTTLNVIVKLATKIGRKLAPTFLKFLGVVKRAFAFLERNPALVKFGLVMAGLAAAIGPVLALFGAFLLVLPGLATAASALGIGLGGITLAVLGLPAALVVVGAALVGFISDWDSAGKAISIIFTTVWDGITAGFDAMISGILSGIDFVARGIKSILPKSVLNFIRPDFKSERSRSSQNSTGNPTGRFGLSAFSLQRPTPRRAGAQNNVNVSNSAQLEIKVDAPVGTVTKIKRQSGFDRLEVNRGLQGAN